MATNSQSTANGGTSHDGMHELATAIVAAMRQPKQLTPSQQRVELGFRLIRNGLGNFGGHGDVLGDRALIHMQQTDNKEGGCVLTFLDELPERVRVAVVFPEGSGDIERRRLGQSRPGSIDVGFRRISLVEFRDEFDALVAAGIPSTTPVVTGPAVARTADQAK